MFLRVDGKTDQSFADQLFVPGQNMVSFKEIETRWKDACGEILYCKPLLCTFEEESAGILLNDPVIRWQTFRLCL